MTEAGLLLTHALARACSDRAIDTLRLEKGYKVWGSDITADYTPYEAGLGFCVNLDSGGDFIGRDALAAAAEHGPRRRLATFTMDAEAPAGVVLHSWLLLRLVRSPYVPAGHGKGTGAPLVQKEPWSHDLHAV